MEEKILFWEAFFVISSAQARIACLKLATEAQE